MLGLLGANGGPLAHREARQMSLDPVTQQAAAGSGLSIREVTSCQEDRASQMLAAKRRASLPAASLSADVPSSSAGSATKHRSSVCSPAAGQQLNVQACSPTLVRALARRTPPVPAEAANITAHALAAASKELPVSARTSPRRIPLPTAPMMMSLHVRHCSPILQCAYQYACAAAQRTTHSRCSA